jgi:hypothetical protein
MQLKSKELAHGRFAYCCHVFKNFVTLNSFVMAYSQYCRINKAGASAFAPATVMKKQHKDYGMAMA